MKDRKILLIVILIICLLLSLAITIYNIQHERDSPININTCSKQSLIDLPGIGEVLANRVIENRPYDDIYQLKSIKGIGDKTFNLIESKVVTK